MCSLNWDNVATFLTVAGSEFKTDGAMKLKERCLNDLIFCLNVLTLSADVKQH